MNLWSVGICVKFHGDGDRVYGYSADCEFQESSNNLTGIDGRVGTKYVVGSIEEAVNITRRAAERFGIEFRTIAGMPPLLTVEGDGEDPEAYLPDGWKDMLSDLARSMGWMSYREFGAD